jgi:hypothetical protein
LGGLCQVGQQHACLAPRRHGVWPMPYRAAQPKFRFFASGSAGTGRVEACEPLRRRLLTMALGQWAEDVVEATLAADGGQAIPVSEERACPVPARRLRGRGAGPRRRSRRLPRRMGERVDAAARWNELLPACQDLAAKRRLGTGCCRAGASIRGSKLLAADATVGTVIDLAGEDGHERQSACGPAGPGAAGFP